MSASAIRLMEILGLGPVVPVLTIEDAAEALPLAAALHAGGLRVIEVTLRSAAALPALEQIARRHSDLVVGAGTVRRPEDFRAARDAGAQFAVSPGFTPELHAAAAAAALPWLPGVATPSEVLLAQAVGHDLLKFFPADIGGGPAALRAFATVFPDVAFCPTGGITAATASALALASATASVKASRSSLARSFRSKRMPPSPVAPEPTAISSTSPTRSVMSTRTSMVLRAT